MDLILWRHADAREPDERHGPEGPALSPKGERQAHRMAQWLNLHLPDSTRILVSPTLRTCQTAQALDRKFRIVKDLGPEAPVEGLLGAARWPDAREPVLVVGHQSTLGLAAAYLLTGSVQPLAFRKGSVWWIKRRERDGRVDLVLHAVMSPQHL